MKQLFLEIYAKVFNEDGSIKNCGRTVCIQLISLAKQLGTDTDYGNADTGFINIETMQKLYEQINQEAQVMKKVISYVLISICLMFCLMGCKDKSYAGLAIPENKNKIYDLCRSDPTFTDSDAQEIAEILADLDFKKIKKTKEYEGGTEKKIVITDTNGVGYVIIMSNNTVIAVQADGGQSIYIRTIKKEKDSKK